MADTLKGKVILVTGALGDLGSAIVENVCAEGATVLATDLLPDGDPTVVQDNSAAYLSCDVRNHADILRVVQFAVASYGRIDALVAAAGTVKRATPLDISPGDWDAQLETNLRGSFLTAQAVAQTMVARGVPGSIIFLGSWIGKSPARGMLPYCVSKAGIDMIARCLALELGGSNIRVNVVAPGVVDAGVSAQIFRELPERKNELAAVVPLGTLGTSREVADAVRFLLSGSASYVTGTTLVVDGGIRLSHAGG